MVEDQEQAHLKERYEAAVESFVGKIGDDPNVLAVIVAGSLAYDVVWEKSDIDTTVVVRDQSLKRTSYCIVEDGITLNVNLSTRSDFRRGLDRGKGGSSGHSYYAKGRMVYCSDDSLAEAFEEFKHAGQDDIALSALFLACELVSYKDKCEKWLTARKDPLYAQYYLLKTAEIIAHMELCLAGIPASRESIQKAVRMDAGLMAPFYQEAMSRHYGEEDVRRALGLIEDYLLRHLDTVKRPVLELLADQEVKTVTVLTKALGSDGHFLIGILDYLAEQGVIEKVSQTIRITPKSRLAVEEIGFLYIPE